MIELLAAAELSGAMHDEYAVPFWLCSIMGGALVSAIVYLAWNNHALVGRLDTKNEDFTKREVALKTEALDAHKDCTAALIKNTESDGKIITALATLETTIKMKLGD